MRVLCPHCASKALITSTNQMSNTVKDLYCTCTNHDCNAAFVFTLAYSHDLNPPKNDKLALFKSLITYLNPSDKQRLQRDLFS